MRSRFLLVCFSLLINTGVVDAQWIRKLGGKHTDGFFSMDRTSDGGYILAGETMSFGLGTRRSSDMWIVKTNSSGYPAWQKTLGGKADDEASAIQQTADGGYVVAGNTTSSGAGKMDGCLIKLDSSGSIAWQKTYGGELDDQFMSVRQTSDGGYVVAGATLSFSQVVVDAWCMKVDSAGTIVWQETIDIQDDNDSAIAARPTPDGGCIVAGVYETWSVYHVWCIKLDSAGKMKWQRGFGYGASDDVINSLIVTKDGSALIAGATLDSYYSPSADVWCAKISGSGKVKWKRQFYQTGQDNGPIAAFDVKETSGGGFVLAGKAYPNPSSGLVSDIWCALLNPTGGLLWQKQYGALTYPGPYNPGDQDEIYSAEEIQNGGFMLAGRSGYGDYNGIMVQLLPDGDTRTCDNFVEKQPQLLSTPCRVENDKISSTIGNSSAIVKTSQMKVLSSKATPTEFCGGYDSYAPLMEGGMLHFDGVRRSPIERAAAYAIRCVWGTKENDVFAVGRSGAILQHAGAPAPASPGT